MRLGAGRRGAAETARADAIPSLASEAERFRTVLTTGRSAVFLQLFDFLVAHAGDERAPKEIEVALAIFGKDGSRDTLQDSAVRVYVHRLRKRLDDYYLGKSGPRLQILKGEYRLVLAVGAPADSPALPPPGWRPGGARLWMAGFAAVLIANAAAWPLFAPAAPRAQAAVRPRDVGALWRSVAAKGTPLVVIGDSYVLAETSNQKDVKRLVLDPAIQSREALGGYLTTHPTAFLRYYDLDLHYAPVGAAAAAWALLPVVSGLRRDQATPRLISSSRLTAQDLEANAIVYVGQLANLDILAAPLARASGFRVEAGGDVLSDVKSGTRYMADTGAGHDEPSRLDYGYLASFPGPSGRRVIVVAGLGDLGVRSMARLVRDRAALERVAPRSGAAFEALYTVRAMGETELDRTPLLVRPLRASGMWDARPPQG